MTKESTSVPVQELQKLCERCGYTHVVVLARTNGQIDHVGSYGISLLQTVEAANFANTLKDHLGWPKALHGLPHRVARLIQSHGRMKTAIQDTINQLPVMSPAVRRLVETQLRDAIKEATAVEREVE